MESQMSRCLCPRRLAVFRQHGRGHPGADPAHMDDADHVLAEVAAR